MLDREQLKKDADCYNQRFGHNFPIPGAECTKCGISQTELSGRKLRRLKKIDE